MYTVRELSYALRIDYFLNKLNFLKLREQLKTEYETHIQELRDKYERELADDRSITGQISNLNTNIFILILRLNFILL